MYRCPFDFLWGISCPGCGMTRALSAFFIEHNLQKAFYFHPLFPVVLLAVPLLFLHFSRLHRFRRKTVQLFLSVFCFLFVTVYIIRLFLCPELVSIHVEQGLFFRLLSPVLS